jgi:plastocyanin
MRLRLPALILAVLALAAAGCGDDDDSDGGGGGGGDEEQASKGGGATKLALAADPGGALKFNKTSLEAKAGTVTIAFDNPSNVPHAVEVEGKGVEEETDVITESSANLNVDLEAGEYKFYCPVGNHEQAGMVGTLTVR